MESVEFCGLACHSVMEPEHTAHARSPHSRVGCAECHIGPGADWFVKSKLDGAWQLVSVAFDLYPRPVPTPLHDLRPARETCEQCHWPTKFVGDKLKVIKHYEEDEENTELTTALLLKVGGSARSGSHGIHWHVDPDVQIRYRSDETREEIYEVEYTHGDGETIRLLGPQSAGRGRHLAGDGLRRLPQSAVAYLRVTGPAIDRAIAGRADRQIAAIRQAREPAHHRCRVRVARGGTGSNNGRADSILCRELSGHRCRASRRHRGGGDGAGRYLFGQRISRA